MKLLKYFFIGIKVILSFIYNFSKYFYLGERVIFIFTYHLIKYFLIGAFTLIGVLPRYFIIGISSIFIKKVPNDKAIDKVLMILGVIVYLMAVYIIAGWIMQNKKAKDLTNEIINETPIDILPNEDIDVDDPFNDPDVEWDSDYYDYQNLSYISVDFTELLRKNPDTVGWIKVEGTSVNYPIVQTNDNSFYLTHSFNKNYSYAGWIFADFRNNFTDFGNNTIIYGHNTRANIMFGTLSNILTNNWQKNINNHYVKISTPYKNTVWKVFSVYMIDPEIYYISTIFDDDSYTIFLDTITTRSSYNFKTEVSINDKIVTLSTCNNSGTKRIVLHAKLISEESR